MTAGSRRRYVLAALSLAGTLTTAVPMDAQVVGLRLGRGALAFEAQGGRDSGGKSLTGDRGDLRMTQRLRLPFSGYLLDPRVMTFSLSLSPTFSQYESALGDRPSRLRNTTYDMSSTFFSRRQLSVGLRAARTSGQGEAPFGVHSESNGSSLVAQARFRHKYFPVIASYSNRYARNLWVSPVLAAPIEVDRRIGQARVEMNNAKLRAVFERSFIDDLRESEDEVRTSASFNHRLRWGKASSLQSSLRFEGREGGRAASIFSWNEQMQITHTETALTRLQWNRLRWSGSASDLSLDVAGLVTQLQPKSWLGTHLSLSSRTVSNSVGTGNSGYQVTPTVLLNRGAASGWRGNLTLSVGLRGNTRLQLTDDTWVEALAEEHRIDRSRRFVLDHLGADPSTLEVWESDGSYRYLEGIDFLQTSTGGGIEVRALPGGRLEEGDVVSVNYRYRALSERSGRSTFTNVSGSLGNRHVTLDFGKREQSGDPLDASGGVDQVGTSETWVGVSLELPETPVGRLRVVADRRYRTYGTLDTQSRDAHVTLDLPFRGRLNARLGAGFGRAADKTSAVRNSTLSGDFGWRLSRTARVDGGVSRYVWGRDAGDQSERFFGARASVNWDWGLFATRLQVHHNARKNGVRLTSNRWDLTVTRTF